MKAALILGMAVALSQLAVLPSYASKGGAREAIAKYADSVRASAFGAAKSAANLPAAKRKAAQDKIVNELGINGVKASSLNLALNSADSATAAAHLDNLAVVIAGQKYGQELAKTNKEEGESLVTAANSGAKIIAHSGLVGATKKSTLLNDGELVEVRAGLGKLASMPELMVTRFNKAERDSYSQIVNKYDELMDAGRTTPEDAFVTAIMQVKKVDKAGALVIVKKLKDCV